MKLEKDKVRYWCSKIRIYTVRACVRARVCVCVLEFSDTTELTEALFACLFVCLFVCLYCQSTAMVIAGWSAHLTTLFPGKF